MNSPALRTVVKISRQKTFLVISAFMIRGLGTEVAAEKAPFVVELDGSSWNSTLAQVPSSAYMIVEFFAPWCPHCQQFKPQYDRVAALFNTEPRTTPQIVVASVDCVAQDELCNLFGVKEYPMMLFGHPKGFAATQAHSLHRLKQASTADAVVKEINARLGTAFVLSTDTTYGHTYNQMGEAMLAPHEGLTQQAASQVSLSDVEKATVLSIEYMHTAKLLMPTSRRAFVDWIKLLAQHHPVPRCRAGSKHLFNSLEEVWPTANGSHPTSQLLRWRVCGRHAVQSDWVACKGSTPSTRGYSCGLWLLFHALANSNIEPPSGEDKAMQGAMWMQGVRAFVGTFFTCIVCRDHFMEMATSHTASKVKTQRDASMWMWETHNLVNQRLAGEEAESQTGDVAFPKEQWPSQDACPPCRTHALIHTDSASEDKPDWDMEVVFEYNRYYYGNGTRPKGVPATLPVKVPEERKPVSLRAVHPGKMGDGGKSLIPFTLDLGTAMSMVVSGVGLVLCAYILLKSLATRRRGLKGIT